MKLVKLMEGVRCVCVWLGLRGWRSGEWMRGLGFTNPVGTGEVLDMCLCFGCGGWVSSGQVAWTRVWGMGWSYVCVSCESRLSVQMVGPGICVLFLADTCASEVHPVFNPVAPL